MAGTLVRSTNRSLTGRPTSLGLPREVPAPRPPQCARRRQDPPADRVDAPGLAGQRAGRGRRTLCRRGLDLNDKAAGWSIITVKGAKQRGCLGGEQAIDPDKVEQWVSNAIKERPAAYVADLITPVTKSHGEIPEKDILQAIDTIRFQLQDCPPEGTPLHWTNNPTRRRQRSHRRDP
jgi:hypothetical protein